MDRIQKFYDTHAEYEWDRLQRHKMEFATNMRMLEEFLPAPPCRLLDVGGGPPCWPSEDAAQCAANEEERPLMKSEMDEVYRRPDFYWGQEPNRICRQVAELFPGDRARGKRVIDLGCGEGRDVIHFARQGFEAVGVDLSGPGLAKARAWAAAEGLSIRTHQADLAAYRLDQEYDVVYASGVLTYLPPHVRQEAFANYKRFTAPGGMHAFNYFVEKPFIPTPPDWGAHEYFYRSGEVLQHYWDWEILHLSEVIFDCNSSGVPHRHAMGVMIARKA